MMAASLVQRTSITLSTEGGAHLRELGRRLRRRPRVAQGDEAHQRLPRADAVVRLVDEASREQLGAQAVRQAVRDRRREQLVGDLRRALGCL
jgi:hypothetical protein